MHLLGLFLGVLCVVRGGVEGGRRAGEEVMFSEMPVNRLAKYATTQLYSLIEMLSGFTSDAGDVQEWVESYYPSILREEGVDLKAAAREYIETKMSVENEWRVIEHRSFPDYRLRVRKPPGLKMDTVIQYAGYIDYKDKHYFYYFFESRNSPLTDPLILWLNGGPGCSSMYGLFYTLGPSKFDDVNKSLYYNPWSWNHRSSIIFLDQPVDVGFSYTDDERVVSTPQASWNFYTFMVMFFTAFPQYAKLEFHLAGESYAGHYIPIFAAEIMEYNVHKLNVSDVSENLTKLPEINLKSVMIGNGYVDPYSQFPYYYHMGCKIPGNVLLSEKACLRMRNSIMDCRSYINLCSMYGCRCTCLGASSFCDEEFLEPFLDEGVSLYDRRERCKDNCSIDYLFSNFTSFLNKNKAALNATPNYTLCNFNITREFRKRGEAAESVLYFVSSLLEQKIKVLAFVGDQDIICNWYGTHSWTHNMEWNNSVEFNKLKLRTWTLKKRRGKKLKGTIAGQVKHHAGLTLLRVRDAGHAVGETQPEYNFDMYMRWLDGDYEFSN